MRIHVYVQKDGLARLLIAVLSGLEKELGNCPSLKANVPAGVLSTQLHKLWQMCWCPSHAPSAHPQKSCATLVMVLIQSNSHLVFETTGSFVLGTSMGQLSAEEKSHRSSPQAMRDGNWRNTSKVLSLEYSTGLSKDPLGRSPIV